MLTVVEWFHAPLIEGIDDRRFDRRVQRLHEFDIDHGLVQESLFVQPIDEVGGRW